MSVVTRFAPSPSGFLHIGGARTALFNWLFARHNQIYGGGGKYLLRIEDTDQSSSKDLAVDYIYKSLKWLGIEWDGEVVLQAARAQRHREVAKQLLSIGKGYNCYCTPEELGEMRQKARLNGTSVRYDRRWRDKSHLDAPKGISPVIRMKMPISGVSTLQDLVQGAVSVSNEQLDDLVLLRSDGSPTYMLAAVVDDYDMGITHVIRGDDHLTNAFRQAQIYLALGWKLPSYAHIPLILGSDGVKLSKRHGALGVEIYRELGFLPDALFNYLLRLGWGHRDEEIFSKEQATRFFSIDGIGKSPARFDLKKLTSLNGHYIRQADNKRLFELVKSEMQNRDNKKFTDIVHERIFRGIQGLKERSKTIVDLVDSSMIYAVMRPIELKEEAANLLTGDAKLLLGTFITELSNKEWSRVTIENETRNIAEQAGVKLVKLAQPLRAAVTGETISPSIFEVMEILGREETLSRIRDVL